MYKLNLQLPSQKILTNKLSQSDQKVKRVFNITTVESNKFKDVKDNAEVRDDKKESLTESILVHAEAK